MSALEIIFKEPEEARYEDRYGQYLDFLKTIAETDINIDVTVHNAPWSWTPLLNYLHCEIINPIYRFHHCGMVRRAVFLSRRATNGSFLFQDINRTALEVLCGFRPELVDALYKIDTQWKVPPRRMRLSDADEFIVTNNGSFHRHEVLGFMQELKAYRPSKRKVVLVPCAADKPYPAPLHKAVLDMLPDDYYLAIATGVLGIVPMDMWDRMPNYDSGIPNQWRLFESARAYFGRIHHERIIVYCDFYAHVLSEALLMETVHYVLPPIKYDDYVNLLAPANLARLKHAFEEDKHESVAPSLRSPVRGD